MRAAVITVALALAAAGARADTPPTPAAAPSPADTEDVIGLLDVRVDGLSPAATEAFTAKIEQSLEISGLKVASGSACGSTWPARRGTRAASSAPAWASSSARPGSRL
jgi:hypothetical protein